MTQAPPPPSLDEIKNALFELTELPEPARAARLADLALQRPALAQALQGLLPGAMATVASANAPARWLQDISQSGLPQQLGKWRVLREIGRGGMGVVLLGERADGAFDKQVAIKVLPPALAGANGARRLAAEAQALARLEHPHIARLLDAGVDQGCAYLVMEHVAGLPITAHAQQGALGQRQQLALLLQLCSAVQFAHGQLLVHRDIKPDNVLVDTQGQVRLLDFGIAKVLHADAPTATVQAALTPAYASPEQLLGQPSGVAGDVFSLGVLLFQLLTGRHPFLASTVTANGTASVMAQVRAVLDGQPDTAALRQAKVPADLQAVVLKALEKPLQQRYASVEALAGELQAFLAGLPVKAQPPNWRYRATKFVQRNRWPVLAGTLATSAVLGLTAWALHSAQQARQQQTLAQARLQTVRAIANKVVFDYNRALEPVPGTLEVRQTLIKDALTYLDAMVADAPGQTSVDRALQADIAAGYEAVGDVQGRGVTGGNLGDLPAAQRSYERAVALRRPLCELASAGANAKNADTNLTTAVACSAWAASLVRLGDNAFTQRRTDDAITHFDSARAAAKRTLDLPLPPADTSRKAALDLRSQANQRLAGLSLRQTGAAYDRGLALAQDQLQAAQALAACRA
jgi:eukaryotic-like serine/threonine-protein kinase